MNLRELQTDPAAFRGALLVDTDAGPRRFADCLDPWQAEDFAALDPSWRRVAGQTDEPRYLRAWLERGRGHSKTTDIAVQASWVLFASRRKLDGVACAADKDQASLIRDAVDRLLRLNPWLAQVLECQAGKIYNRHTGSTLTILASDAASSYGLLIDFAIVDELTHWSKRELWDSIFSAIAKRRHGLLLVIANAGFQDSWVWPLRQAVSIDDGWYFHRLEGPVASWISPKHLAEQERLLPRQAFERLWRNQWCKAAGDALLADDIDAAVTLHAEVNRPEQGYCHILGLDLGLKRDFSALVMLRKHVGYSERIATPGPRFNGTMRALADLELVDVPAETVEYRHHPGTNRLQLAAVRVWNPREGRVEIERIEREIVELHERFGLTTVAVDPWQGEFLVERLQKLAIPTHAVYSTPQTLQQMASCMLDAFRERQVELYPHDGLLQDLRALRVTEKSYGYRLTSPRSADSGHGDVATAFSLALLAAKDIRSDFTFSQRQLCYN